MRRILLPAVLATALVLALALAPSAAAFSAAPHGRITGAGAEGTGFPPDALPALRQAVLAPDASEMEWDPTTGDLKRVDADGSFRPEHHCDRVPPAGHLESFNATVAFIASAIEAAVAASQAGEPDEAIHHLGYALHAAQDCSSHSNAVDLGIADAYPGMILGDAAPPAGLWLTGFQPGASDPERPEGDAYSHGEYAKDSAGSSPEAGRRLPDNQTKYEAARDIAEATTRQLLMRFVARLDGEQVEALADVEPVDDGTSRVGIPLPPAFAAGVALAGTVLALARRRGWA